MRKELIVGVILIIITGISAKFIFNEKAELKYTISDRIPSKFINGDESESIQQLELLNTGDIQLDKILVKIRSQIIEYDILKIASTDSVIHTKTDGKLEIIYSVMPPETKMKIIIKSSGSGISQKEVEISHSKGLAKLALDINNNIDFIPLILSLIYVILLLILFRESMIESMSHYIYFYPLKNILLKIKPWYFGISKWNEIRNKSIEYAFIKDSSYNIINEPFFLFLSSEKNEYLSSEEWNSLKLKAQDKFLEVISFNVNKGYDWKIDELLSISKPIKMDNSAWKEIKEYISKAYVTTKSSNINIYTSSEKLSVLKNLHKPNIIEENDWEDYQKLIGKYISLNDLISKNESIEMLFSKITFGDPLANRPEEISTEKWQHLKTIEETIWNESKKLDQKILQLKEDEQTIPILKEKLEKQLKIIHEVLTDHTAIDRIEDFANPFSSGNFQNLRRISIINSNDIKQSKS